MTFNTPILLLVFNRPNETSRVLNAIRKVKPARLYISGDGPRHNHPHDADKIAEVRKVVDQIDWPCKVNLLFRDKNLGCKKAVSDALDWFFRNEEMGIVLEDDCLPNHDFFSFCECLLHKYEFDDRVSVITGDNFQNGKTWGDGSYYFSKYNHCWGWASWRRAWKSYDGEMSFWPTWSKSADWVKKMPDVTERNFWANIFTLVNKSQLDSWAYPWTGSVIYHGGLTATPNVNLVKNIGFGLDSTHTSSTDSELSEMETYPIGQIIHPNEIAQNVDADRYAFDHVFGGLQLRYPRRLMIIAKKVIKRFLSFVLSLSFKNRSNTIRG